MQRGVAALLVGGLHDQFATGEFIAHAMHRHEPAAEPGFLRGDLGLQGRHSQYVGQAQQTGRPWGQALRRVADDDLPVTAQFARSRIPRYR